MDERTMFELLEMYDAGEALMQVQVYLLRINVKNPGRVETRTVNVGNRGKPR